jgi:hypothetical protein
MKEIILNEKTQEKVKGLFSVIKQAEGQVIALIETYLDASGEYGKWQLTQDLSKIVVQEEEIVATQVETE